MIASTTTASAAHQHHNIHSAPLPARQVTFPTLDLHGCTKPQAIRRVTDFLDFHRTKDKKKKNAYSNKLWLCIVTGSGVHSQEGPILRNAVQTLFQKRHMEFQLNRPGKGSFLVNAKSGIVLYRGNQPEYSKVVVVPDMEPGANVKLVGRAAPSVAAAAIDHIDGSTNLMSYPLLPKQPRAGGSSALQLQMHRHAKVNRGERHNLTRVLSDSALEYDRHVQLDKDEEERWLAVVEQSKVDTSSADREEEERVFQEMLAASVAELKHQEEDEEQQLQAILAQSATEVENNDEDLSLEEALKMSLMEAPPSSVDEDEALRLVLEQSLLDL